MGYELSCHKWSQGNRECIIQWYFSIFIFFLVEDFLIFILFIKKNKNYFKNLLKRILLKYLLSSIKKTFNFCEMNVFQREKT